MKNKGFTIIESLVAITILLVAIAGTGSAIQTGISSYTYSRNQFIAFYLAQEGFEQIRNIRDENSLNNRNWLTGISLDAVNDPCYFGQSCSVEPTIKNYAERCGAPGSCPILRQNATSGFFGYNPTWPRTVFKRNILLTRINDHEVSVEVTIDWSKGVVTRQFKAKENIFDWQ